MKPTVLAALLFASAAAHPALAQAPDTLRVAVPGNDLGTLDPDRGAATSDINILSWMFNGLVRFPPGTADVATIEPDLAESWTASEDRKTWTFRIRDGVKCQAGFGDFTASDAAFSLERAMDKGRSSYFSDLSAVQSVEAPDPRTLRIVLKDRVPSLLGLLVPYHGGNMMCRKAVEAAGDDVAHKPVGTGPFTLAEYKPQQYVRLEANDAYWRGKPHLRSIVVRFILSEASRDLAFTAGEIDLENGRYEQSWISRMQAAPNTTVAVMGPGELHSLYLNASKPPLDNPKVREAIGHAVDRAGLVKFRGDTLAKPATSVIPSGFLGYEKMDLPRYDVAEAKRLLAEAGYKDGLTLKVIQTTLPAMMTTMQVVQSQLRAAGITLDIVPVDHPTYHAQIRQDLSQIVYYGAARFPVADSYLSQFFHSAAAIGAPSAITNFAHCNAADADITAARTEADPAKQVAEWVDAQKRIVAAGCVVPMYEMLTPWAWKSNLDIGSPTTAALSLAPPISELTRFR